jgi:hypothetical protein
MCFEKECQIKLNELQKYARASSDRLLEISSQCD